MRGLRIGLASIIMGSALFAAGPAAASKPTVQFYFYDCVGDGPTDFWAEKTATPPQSGGAVSAGAAYDLVDGSGTYQILSFGVGNFDPPGIRSHSSSYNLVCLIDFAQPVGTTTIYGNFAWTP